MHVTGKLNNCCFFEVKVVKLLIITEKITIKFGRAKTAKSVHTVLSPLRLQGYYYLGQIKGYEYFLCVP